MCAGISAYSEVEVFHQVGNLLHWIMDYLERYEREYKLPEKKKKVLSGIRFINNCLKHNEEFIDFKDRLSGCTTFPVKMDGTGAFFCYVWRDMSYLSRESYRYIDQFNAYQEVCMGVPIILIFRECMEVIDPTLLAEWCK